MTTFNPFVKKDAPPPVTEAVTAATAVVEEKPAKRKAKEDVDKKARADELTHEKIIKIMELVANTKKSYSEIAAETGTTKFQVNRVIMDMKKILNQKAQAGDQKALLLIERLKRPTRPGMKKDVTVKGTIGNLIEDLLSKI